MAIWCIGLLSSTPAYPTSGFMMFIMSIGMSLAFELIPQYISSSSKDRLEQLEQLKIKLLDVASRDRDYHSDIAKEHIASLEPEEAERVRSVIDYNTELLNELKNEYVSLYRQCKYSRTIRMSKSGSRMATEQEEASLILNFLEPAIEISPGFFMTHQAYTAITQASPSIHSPEDSQTKKRKVDHKGHHENKMAIHPLHDEQHHLYSNH